MNKLFDLRSRNLIKDLTSASSSIPSENKFSFGARFRRCANLPIDTKEDFDHHAFKIMKETMNSAKLQFIGQIRNGA